MIIEDKVQKRKHNRKNDILNSAFDLFLEEGINDTSIDDIVEGAGVAKGTFYLYFRNKFEVRDALVVRESKNIFNQAVEAASHQDFNSFVEQFLFILDHIIEQLRHQRVLLKFIEKNLSAGVFTEQFTNVIDRREVGLYEMFLQGIQKDGIELKNPRVTLYMIVELSSSIIYNSLLYGEPLKIEDCKPYLYDAVKRLLS